MRPFTDDGGSQDKPGYFTDGFGNTYPITVAKETVFGAGAAIGTKFLTRKGFTGDFYLGATKTFNGTVAAFVPRAGLTLGKRF